MWPLYTLLFAVLTSSASAAEGTTACNENGSQMELNACAQERFHKADAALNQTYQAILQTHRDDRLFIDKLRKAQRAWIAFVDADLAARFSCEDENPRICWGSMYPMLLLDAKADLADARVRQLKTLLEPR